MRLARFSKGPGDVKRYTIDYSQWLDEEETLVDVQASVDDSEDGIYPEGVLIDGENSQMLIVYVGGGVAGLSYDLLLRVTTSGNQVREDFITYSIRLVPDFQ